MADKLFHRRRARSKRDLRRRNAQRDPYDRVLVVCEGSKTEPKYFQDWCDSLKLNSANIEVVGDCDSDPLSVVNYGIERYREDSDFDKVLCVFDRDTHTTYDNAIQRLNGQDPNVFSAVRSVPCFEYWLVLHYHYTTRAFTTAQAIAEVRGHIAGYKKGLDGVAATTSDKVNDAIRHARRVRKQGRREGFNHPFTNVDELIVYLRSLKQ